METVSHRLGQWWCALSARGRRTGSALAVIGLVYTVHYLVYCLPQPFYIEDAGISFAYARNLVNGEGLVTFAGGERVEGYSNPSWTFLVAFFYWLGVPTWTSAKLMGWVFGLATLPLSWDLVRRALPDRSDTVLHRDTVALLAPMLLAASVQFVVWNSSGLENSLFLLLLTWGMARCIKELEDGGRPISAVLFFLLCISRPEGIMYAFIAGCLRLLCAIFPADAHADTRARRRFGALLGWTALLLVPLVAYHAWRYWYFAWEFPNTYYAKLGTGRAFKPFVWDRKGWKYIVGWFKGHGGTYAIPFVIAGLVGFSRRLRWLGLGMVMFLALVIGWDGKEGLGSVPDWFVWFQKHWVHLRVWTVASLVPILWLATTRQPGWRARGLLWLNAAAGLFFVVYVGGDWMKAHRWFNLLSVPLLSIFATGLGLVALAFAGRTPWVASGKGVRKWMGALFSRRVWGVAILCIALLAWVGNETRLTVKYASNPETSVRDIHRRVKYMSWVKKRLDLEHITLLDVDMGAHMFFTDWQIVDIAGLVDVPMARHSDFNKKFLLDYLFNERNPVFAHVHGGWARSSRIPKLKPWKDNYLELPGYPIGGRKLHVGNHVRRDTFINKKDTRPAVAVFAGDVELVEVSVPSPEVQPGGQVFLDSTWRARYRKAGFRILAVLDGEEGARTVHALAPGYDWYRPKNWKRNESVEGRFRIPVPEDLPEGRYTLSLVLLDEATGAVMPVQQSVATKDGEPPAIEAATGLLAGGYRVADTVMIVSPEAAGEAAEDDRLQAMDSAGSGGCEDAWSHWKNATRHVAHRTTWQAQHVGLVKQGITDCFVARADGAETREVAVAALVAARVWNHRDKALTTRARTLAALYDADGDVAQAGGEVQAAYDAYLTALSLDPRLSWTRRKAEDMRDERLKIVRPSRMKKGKKKKKK